MCLESCYINLIPRVKYIEEETEDNKESKALSLKLSRWGMFNTWVEEYWKSS